MKKERPWAFVVEQELTTYMDKSSTPEYVFHYMLAKQLRNELLQYRVSQGKERTPKDDELTAYATTAARIAYLYYLDEVVPTTIKGDITAFMLKVEGAESRGDETLERKHSREWFLLSMRLRRKKIRERLSGRPLVAVGKMRLHLWQYLVPYTSKWSYSF